MSKRIAKAVAIITLAAAGSVVPLSGTASATTASSGVTAGDYRGGNGGKSCGCHHRHNERHSYGYAYGYGGFGGDVVILF